ncbi:MAG: gamma-glutamyltransferase [Pseudomonadota bacterium]
MNDDWRTNAHANFTCQKRPAIAADGMVVTNHPLASAAGAEILAGGGNAVDAAITSLFALTVVEPMMVGIIGGGLFHLRRASGEHTLVDGQACASHNATSTLYEPVSDAPPDYLETRGRENSLGPKAVAVPGALQAWQHTLERYGTLSLDTVLAPAIRYASSGFRVTPYLSACIDEVCEDLAHDPHIRARYLPDGRPLTAGTLLRQPDYADTLTQIARHGASIFYHGELGRAFVTYLRQHGGVISEDDLARYQVVERDCVRGNFHGTEIVGPPPPSSGGTHVIQMLNVLEGYDIAGLGFGSPDVLHLLAEVHKIAFADRAAATADPDFVDVPVDTLIDKRYAGTLRDRIDLAKAKTWSSSVHAFESANTTHVTVADRDGNVVAATQTINSLFGARILIPGLGVIPNNYMYIFDPHPGQVLSIEPGKRVTTSMSPIIACRDGQPRLALGLPGGLRIFGSAMQALLNAIAFGMSPQEMVEAPRIWTQGQEVELEPAYGRGAAALSVRGHRTLDVPHVGGGMNAIAIAPDGLLAGAACWRADGTPIGIGGGLADAKARFWADRAPETH